MEILIFKTNLSSTKSVKKIKNHLDEMEGIIQWNVDLEDRDKVLRVKTENLDPGFIMELVTTKGFECEELV